MSVIIIKLIVLVVVLVVVGFVEVKLIRIHREVVVHEELLLKRVLLTLLGWLRLPNWLDRLMQCGTTHASCAATAVLVLLATFLLGGTCSPTSADVVRLLLDELAHGSF